MKPHKILYRTWKNLGYTQWLQKKRVLRKRGDSPFEVETNKFKVDRLISEIVKSPFPLSSMTCTVCKYIHTICINMCVKNMWTQTLNHQFSLSLCVSKFRIGTKYRYPSTRLNSNKSYFTPTVTDDYRDNTLILFHRMDFRDLILSSSSSYNNYYGNEETLIHLFSFFYL